MCTRDLSVSRLPSCTASLSPLHPQPEAETNQRRLEFREKLEARARLRRESHGLASLYPSHATHARPRPHAHAYVQTENYYEPVSTAKRIDVRFLLLTMNY